MISTSITVTKWTLGHRKGCPFYQINPSYKDEPQALPVSSTEGGDTRHTSPLQLSLSIYSPLTRNVSSHVAVALVLTVDQPKLN